MKSKSLTRFWLLALLIICGYSSVQEVRAQRTSTSRPSTTYRSGGGGGTRYTTFSPNSGQTGTGTSSSNGTSSSALDYSNIVVNNVTQMQVVDERYLKVFMYPTENMLEIECRLNLSTWKQTAEGRNSSANDKLMLRLGFERVEEDSMIDIVSIGLDGENVAENSRGSSKSSNLKDFFWNPESGTITLDNKQDYKLSHFNGNESKQYFSIKFTRSWLTCDGQDTQFTLAAMNVYWTIAPEKDPNDEIEYGNVNANSGGAGITPSPGRGTSTSTLRPRGTSSTTSRSGTGRTRSPLDYSSTISPAGESTKSNTTQDRRTNTTTKPKVIKIFKDYKFLGPVKVALNNLFQNFTYLQIKGCGSIFTTIYQCSYPDYKNKSYLSSEESPFFIVKAIHQPNATEVGKSIEIDGKVYKPERCPNERFSFKGWNEGRLRGKSLLGASAQKNDATKPSAMITNLLHMLAFIFYSSFFPQ